MTTNGTHAKFDLAMGFDRTQSAKIVGLPYPTVTNWANAGFIVPSIRDEGISGVPALYDLTDCFKLSVAKRLTESGISISEVNPTLSAVGKALREDRDLAGHRKPIGGVIGSRGNATYVDRTTWNAPELAELIRSRECSWALDLEPISKGLREAALPFIKENMLRAFGFFSEKGSVPGTFKVTLDDGAVFEGDNDQLEKQLRLHHLKIALGRRRVVKPAIDPAAAADIEDMARFVGYHDAEEFTADIRRVQDVIAGEQPVAKQR
jgi:hypothetical protein